MSSSSSINPLLNDFSQLPATALFFVEQQECREAHFSLNYRDVTSVIKEALEQRRAAEGNHRCLINEAKIVEYEKYLEMPKQASSLAVSVKWWKIAFNMCCLAAIVFGFVVLSGAVTMTLALSLLGALAVAAIVCRKMHAEAHSSKMLTDSMMFRVEQSFTKTQLDLAMPALAVHILENCKRGVATRDSLMQERGRLSNLLDAEIERAFSPDLKMCKAKLSLVPLGFLQYGLLGRIGAISADPLEYFDKTIKACGLDALNFPGVFDLSPREFSEQVSHGKLPEIAAFLNYAERVARIGLHIYLINAILERSNGNIPISHSIEIYLNQYRREIAAGLRISKF